MFIPRIESSPFTETSVAAHFSAAGEIISALTAREANGGPLDGLHDKFRATITLVASRTGRDDLT